MGTKWSPQGVLAFLLLKAKPETKNSIKVFSRNSIFVCVYVMSVILILYGGKLPQPLAVVTSVKKRANSKGNN